MQPHNRIRAVRHFSHREEKAAPVVTTFERDGIEMPSDILTLVIRKDAGFATRSLRAAFKATKAELFEHIGNAAFSESLDTSYKNWGHAIVTATVEHLDYQGHYGLATDRHHTQVHFHSADSLAGNVIKKACDFVVQKYPERPQTLFVSLDDMIHADVFQSNATHGTFGEIGFSREFSPTGTELGFVGRPGHASINRQIKGIKATLKKMKGGSQHRVPIILLEDNVRRAKTLLWIFERKQKQGVFEHGELAGVATCFSVATPQERANIRHEGKEIPLITGVEYKSDSRIDVVTPRDHMFDGFVVKRKDGSFGRLPSFMLSAEQIAKNFKVIPAQAEEFIEKVIDVNIDFCEEFKQNTGAEPLLEWFTPGPAIAETLDVSPKMPMRDVLSLAASKRLPSLHLVK